MCQVHHWEINGELSIADGSVLLARAVAAGRSWRPEVDPDTKRAAFDKKEKKLDCLSLSRDSVASHAAGRLFAGPAIETRSTNTLIGSFAENQSVRASTCNSRPLAVAATALRIPINGLTPTRRNKQTRKHQLLA